MSTNGLISRITVSESSTDINSLYDAYKLENQDAGLDINVDRRELAEYVINLFPSCKKFKKRINANEVKSFYQGLSLKPLRPLIAPNDTSTDMYEILINLVPSNFIFKNKKKEHLEFFIDTGFKVNGHPVEKHLTFLRDFTWKASVGDKEVDLKSIGVDNTFVTNEESVQTVCNIVEKMKLCQGIEINKSLICSRYHTLESWRDCSTQSLTKRLRSILCLKTIKFNARKYVCRQCQKMTFGKKTEKNDENDKSTISETYIDKTQMKEEFKRLIPCASESMLELLVSQTNNAGRHPRGRRWSQNIINTCLQLYSKSPAGYNALRTSNLLILPSPSVLILYKNSVKHKVGFQEEIFRWMHSEAIRLGISEDGLKGGIILDEMGIQQDIQISKAGDVELIGFEDIGEEGNMCGILRKGKKEKQLGTHILQFMFLGITGFRFPFAHFVTTNIQSYDIHTLFWDAVDHLQMYGFRVVYTCMDGAQSNRTFMNINLGKYPTTMISKNPTDPTKPIVFMMDISHVLKKVRNNVLKSGLLKTSTRNLTLANDHVIQWQMWSDAFKWDQTNGLQLHRKLTNEHIYLSTQSKMRNHLAVEVLNSDMLHLMRQYQASLLNKCRDLDGVIEFLKQTSRMIEIFYNGNPVRNLGDTRLQELQIIDEWFSKWKSAVEMEPISSAEKSRKLMSRQCMEDVHSCLLGFNQLCEILLKDSKTSFITPTLINSDVVENHFCQQRSTYNGANTNPNVLQYQRNQNTIILSQNIISNKANAAKSALKFPAFSYKFQEKKLKKRKASETHCIGKGEIKVIRM